MNSRGKTKEFEYQPDAVWGNVAIEVKRDVHSFRNLRASLLGLAYWLSEKPARRGLLVLVNSRISTTRLREELRFAASVLHPTVSSRISVHTADEEGYLPVFGAFQPPDMSEREFRERLKELIEKEASRRHPRGSANAVLKVLLNRWLLGKGPLTTDWIVQTTGFSYPSVAKALKSLEHCLKRYSDRKVELRYFPRDEWRRLISAEESAPTTARFTDRSSQPRSPESLLRRVKKIAPAQFAVSGVLAARHYYPDFDLTGAPRLDLCASSFGTELDWSFIKELDPGLERMRGKSNVPVLVVWQLDRADPLFEPDSNGLPWADPVQCLIALHDARLEAQTAAFLNSFPAMSGASH